MSVGGGPARVEGAVHRQQYVFQRNGVGTSDGVTQPLTPETLEVMDYTQGALSAELARRSYKDEHESRALHAQANVYDRLKRSERTSCLHLAAPGCSWSLQAAAVWPTRTAPRAAVRAVGAHHDNSTPGPKGWTFNSQRFRSRTYIIRIAAHEGGNVDQELVFRDSNGVRAAPRSVSGERTGGLHSPPRRWSSNAFASSTTWPTRWARRLTPSTHTLWSP